MGRRLIDQRKLDLRRFRDRKVQTHAMASAPYATISRSKIELRQEAERAVKEFAARSEPQKE